MLSHPMQERCLSKSFLLSTIFLASVCDQRAHADQQAGDVEYLYRSCKQAERYVSDEKLNDSSIVSAAYCVGYLKGLYHMQLVNCASTKKSDAGGLQRGFDVSPSALIHSFVRWAEQNLGNWSQSELTAFAVIRQDFPCK